MLVAFIKALLHGGCDSSRMGTCPRQRPETNILPPDSSRESPDRSQYEEIWQKDDKCS